MTDLIEATSLRAKEKEGPLVDSSPPSTVSVTSLNSASTSTAPDFRGFPKPFLIPLKWSDSTAKAISSGKLTTLARKEVTQTLVTLMMVYEQKPTRAQCTQVAMDLVRKYPQMADPIGTPHVSGI